MSDRPSRKRAGSPQEDQVGYGKPPLASRFQKGRSGNPKGRPRGKRTAAAADDTSLGGVILAEARRTMQVKEGEGTITMTVAEAVVRSIAQSAAAGSLPAQQLFMRVLGTAEQDARREADEVLEAATLYKMECQEEIDRCKKEGLPAPDLLPHPDHVEFDVRTGAVRIVGPITAEEGALWDELRAKDQHGAAFEVKARIWARRYWAAKLASKAREENGETEYSDEMSPELAAVYEELAEMARAKRRLAMQKTIEHGAEEDEEG